MKESIIALLAALLASGCASITRGTTEAFVIESEPPGATATLSTGPVCETPCSVKVKRKGDFTVTIEKEGYESIVSTVTSSIDGGGAAGMAGNVLVGGLIGAGIDAGTGAMHSHKPNPLTVTLVPGNSRPGAVDLTDKSGAVAILSDEDGEYVQVVPPSDALPEEVPE